MVSRTREGGRNKIWVVGGSLALAGVVLAELALRHRHRRSARRAPAPGLRPSSQVFDNRNRSWGLRVVALGDSNTYGLGLPYEATFPALLETRLRRLGLKARVWNAGINGETVLQGLARLERDVIQRQPDLVLVAFGLNDCNLQRWPTDDQRERSHFRAGLHRWLDRLHLYRTAVVRGEVLLENWGWRQPDRALATPRPEPRVHPLRFRQALVRLAREVQRRTGARVFLLTANPVRMPARSQARQWEVYRRYNALIRLAAWESGADLVDLERGLRGYSLDALLEPDGVHLTGKGHEMVAEAIWDAWREARLLSG